MEFLNKNKLRTQFDMLMVSSLFGVVPALCYYLVAEKNIFLGLSWNIFLGLLPFYFAIKAKASSNKYVRYFNTFLWFIFLPNAPYLITDLIHIQLNPRNAGFVLYLVAILSFTGLLSWLFSVRLMLARLPLMLQSWESVRKYGYLVLCILSGVGVAMGRFGRLNSWEVFYQPVKVIRSTMHMYTHWFPWVVTFFIALMLYFLKDINIPKFKKIELNK